MLLHHTPFTSLADISTGISFKSTCPKSNLPTFHIAATIFRQHILEHLMSLILKFRSIFPLREEQTSIISIKLFLVNRYSTSSSLISLSSCPKDASYSPFLKMWKLKSRAWAAGPRGHSRWGWRRDSNPGLTTKLDSFCYSKPPETVISHDTCRALDTTVPVT